MPDPRHSLGQRGEDFVAGSLRHAGYAILARNWRHGTVGELDIVARRDDQIVFVEVRTRRGPLAAISWALESVDETKRARLSELALAFLAVHDLEHVPWRIDVAAVSIQGSDLAMEVIHHATDW